MIQFDAIFTIFEQALRDIVNFMFKQFFIVFLCLLAEFLFFTADLDGKNSTLHFNYSVSAWFHISILLKVIFCEIVTLLRTRRQMRKFLTVFLS